MADEQTAASGAGAGAASTQTQNKAVASLAELSPELQAEMNQLIARKEKEWEKKHKPVFDKASQYDDAEREREKQKQAEMTEIEKLKSQLGEHETLKAKLTEYEATFTSILDLRIAAIPEDKKSLVPEGLSPVKVLEWIEKNQKLLYGDAAITASPTSGKPAIGEVDKLRARADAQTAEMYPRCPVGSPDFKAKSDRIYEALKKAGVSA